MLNSQRSNVSGSTVRHTGSLVYLGQYLSGQQLCASKVIGVLCFLCFRASMKPPCYKDDPTCHLTPHSLVRGTTDLLTDNYLLFSAPFIDCGRYIKGCGRFVLIFC